MGLPGISLAGQRLVLASESARRAQLLQLLGLDFEIIASNYDETDVDFEIPQVYVLELALRKAEKVAAGVSGGLVVGADTIVVLDDKILGKPRSSSEAQAMLRDLSGRRHEVYTGFAIIERPSDRVVSEYERTLVQFRELSDVEIEDYVETKSPLDKAGAYGIQDLSAIFVDRIEGCFYNVVGFPVTKFYTTLRAFLS